MAFCIECGANVRDIGTSCPACISQRLSGVRSDDLGGMVGIATPVAGLEPEMMIAQVRLKPERMGVADSSQAPTRLSPLTVWALILGTVSLCIGLLGVLLSV